MVAVYILLAVALLKLHSINIFFNIFKKKLDSKIMKIKKSRKHFCNVYYRPAFLQIQINLSSKPFGIFY